MSAHTKPINLVTTWNIRCGIAAYSAFLVAELKRNAKIRIVRVSDAYTFSPYFLVLGFKTGRSHDLVHVQFAYGMFGDLKLGRHRLLAFTALLFYLGLAFSKSQVVTTFHEVMKTVAARGRVGLTYIKLLNKVICIVSDLIIVHTLESKELMVKNYGVDESKVKVIPMGCYETPLFLDKDACKEKLNLSGKKVITIPGFVSKHKGHDLVVALLPLLDKEVHLLIAGGTRTREDMAYYEKVKKLAQRHHCINRITFHDYFPITSTIMNATDIAILPYRYATESLILRLLIAYKVPTITSDLSVFKEIKQEYDCIELFRSNNKKDLLAKILSLLSDEKKQSLLQEQCQRMWNDRKWSSIAAKHVEAYLEVLSAHPDAIYNEKRQKERIDWLKENISGNSLEIGCATGFITSYVGADVGLDINEYRVKLGKTKHPEKDFIISTAVCLPFKKKAFDTVLIPEVLEHVTIQQAEKILSEARRVGDKILITLPNADKINYDKSLVETPEHKWFPTKEIILKLIKTCKIQYTSENDFILVYGT
jgi:glycosyltransferase involved in cell wall biosynthesis